MTTSLHRLMQALFASFLLAAAALGYWGILQRDPLLARDDNPRRVIEEQRIRRGQIVDRNGVVLAESHYDAALDAVIRQYHYPEMAPATGYYSFRFGEGGIEEAFDAVLRGDAALTPAERERLELLHDPQIGGDVQLTLDLGIQQAADAALGEQRGAIIVLSVPQGKVLALVSHPTYDPNLLDEQWDALAADPAAPLLNRATQGFYQPGTILQGVIVGAALNTGLVDTAEEFNGLPSVTFDSMTLPCADPTPDVNTLVSAYIQACPAPFQQIAVRLGLHQFRNAADAFRLTEAPAFALPVTAPPDAISVNLGLESIGQGDLTVTPLHMALVAAAFANHGQMPPLQVVQAIRSPGGDWQSLPPTGTPKGTISRQSAEQVADLMALAVSNGAAYGAGIPGHLVYGHAGLALAGPEGQMNAWFIGFVYLDGTDQAYVVTVLVEDVDSVTPATQIARTVLQAALDSQP